MPPIIAAIVFTAGIVGLFVLDRRQGVRTSWAIVLPMLWLFIAGSRPVSAWLNMAPVGSPDQYLEGSPIDRAVYALLIASGLVVLSGRWAAVAAIARRNWPFLIFIGYCLISITWSDYSGVAAKRWVKSLGDYVMVLILLTERQPVEAVKRALARVGFVLLPLSVLFVKYYPDMGRAYAARWTGTQFFVGVSTDKNMLGMVCLVFGFTAAWRVMEAWSGPRRDRNRLLLAHGVVLSFAVWLLFLSNSMTALNCFALTTVLVAAYRLSKFVRKRRVLHCAVAAVVLVCVAVLFLNVGGGALEAIGRNPTLTGRTDIWEAVVQVPINPVFGAGFESFWLGDRLERLWEVPITDGVNEAHNGYLELYLNLGWIGVLLFGGLFIAGYRNMLTGLLRDTGLGKLRLGYFVLAAIYNLTEAAIRSTDLVWLAFLLATVALPEIRRTGVAAAKKPQSDAALAEVEQLV